MRKINKRFLAILTSLSLLLTVFGSSSAITTFADKITYSESFTLSEPYSVTDADGDATTVTFGGPEGVISMAVGSAVADDGRIYGTDYYYGYSWTDESYAIVNESEKGTSGEVVYYSSDIISDIRFDTVYSPDDSFWLAKPLEFYASSDGKTYEKIETTRTLAGHTFTNPNFAGVNSKIYDTFTFAESDKIRYIKVVSTINSADNDFAVALNRIFSIEYNKYDKKINYSKSFTLCEPYSVTDANGDSTAVTYGGPEGVISQAVNQGVADDGRLFGTDYYYGYDWTDESYTIVNASGKGTSGEVIYYTPDIISDIRFDTVYSINDDFWLAKPLEFYASSDGKTYKKIETTTTSVGHTFTNPNFIGVNSQIYDTYTFPEGDKIRYIKVVSTINSADNDFAAAFNRIFSIEYNKYDANINYSKSFTLNAPYSVTDPNGDSSAVTYGGPEGVINQAVNPGVADDGRLFGTDYYYGYTWNDESYTIVNESGKGTSGEVVYYTPDIISDIRFDTVYSVNEDFWLAKPLEFYASSDGKTYEKIETMRYLNGHMFTNPNFAGVNSKIYDTYTFLEKEKIHYIKIVSTINSADNDYSAALNRVFGIKYNNYIDWSQIKIGDINEDDKIDSLDLTVLRTILLSDNINYEQNYLCDINTDKKINISDIVRLKKHLAGIIDLKGFLDDDLNDFSKVKSYGDDLMFDSNKPALFEGDFSRVRRSDNGDCWMIWEFESGITEFAAVTYWENNVRDIIVSVSKDNQKWEVIDCSEKNDADLGYGWTKRVFKFYDIDKSNKYVKLDLGPTPEGDDSYSPNISRIRINNIDDMDDPYRLFEERNATTFYLDSEDGSDNNSGTSESEPLQTLNAISKRYFQPGDKILFKSGRTFNGTVTFSGMGSEENPVLIGTYGGEEMAKISANGGNAVQLKMQNVTLENLEITNPNGMMGINIIPVVTGKNDNVTVRNCYIHDINKDQTNFEGNNYEHGGIIVMIDGLEPTWFNDLVFENNVIENVSKCGIFMTSEWTYRPGTWGREGYYNSDSDGWYPSTNVVIRGNSLNKCYGDSILVTGAKDTLIEKNTVTNGFYNPGAISAPAATLWTTNTNDTTIQYNEVSYTNLPEGCGDGEAFDIDISSVRTVIQYNYTHDNQGGMLLMCNNEEGAAIGRDHTVRFNLSVNDGNADKSHAVLMIEGKNPGTKIYNNTIYSGGNTDSIIKQYGFMTQTTTDDFAFINNIFYGSSGKIYKWPAEYGWSNTVFDNNVFVNTNVFLLKFVKGVTVTNEKTADVKFKNSSIDLNNSAITDVIDAFTPTNELRGATNISESGGKDIAGNTFSEIDFYGCVKY